jgi:hypothetical protein
MVMLEDRMMTWRAPSGAAAVAASAVTEIFCQSTIFVSLSFAISFKSRQSRILRRKIPLRMMNRRLGR